MSLDNIIRRLQEAGVDTSIEGLIARERARSKDGEPGPIEKNHREYQRLVAQAHANVAKKQLAQKRAALHVVTEEEFNAFIANRTSSSQGDSAPL